MHIHFPNFKVSYTYNAFVVGFFHEDTIIGTFHMLTPITSLKNLLLNGGLCFYVFGYACDADGLPALLQYLQTKFSKQC